MWWYDLVMAANLPDIEGYVRKLRELAEVVSRGMAVAESMIGGRDGFRREVYRALDLRNAIDPAPTVLSTKGPNGEPAPYGGRWALRKPVPDLATALLVRRIDDSAWVLQRWIDRVMTDPPTLRMSDGEELMTVVRDIESRMEDIYKLKSEPTEPEKLDEVIAVFVLPSGALDAGWKSYEMIAGTLRSSAPNLSRSTLKSLIPAWIKVGAFEDRKPKKGFRPTRAGFAWWKARR